MTPRELREYSRALWEEAETYLMAARNDLKKMGARLSRLPGEVENLLFHVVERPVLRTWQVHDARVRHEIPYVRGVESHERDRLQSLEGVTIATLLRIINCRTPTAQTLL